MSRYIMFALVAAAALSIEVEAQGETLLQTIPPAYQPFAATYDVRLSFKGYSGLVQGYPDCQVDTAGTDIMVGRLTGVEMQSDSGEDVVYTGVLKRTTKMDFCETKPAPTEDQRGWCVVSLDGSTDMEVELTVYGEAGRGAYMKTVAHPGPYRVNVSGDCHAPEKAQVQADYPTGSDGGGGSPNGQEIGYISSSSGPRTTLFASGLARLRPGVYRLHGPNSGWTLEVLGRAAPP